MTIGGLTCPRCGRQASPAAHFCGRCGLDLAPAAAGACPRCVRPVSPGTAFCGGCGLALAGESPQPAFHPQQGGPSRPPGTVNPATRSPSTDQTNTANAPGPVPVASPLRRAATTAFVSVRPPATAAIRRMFITTAIGLVASPFVVLATLAVSYLGWQPLGTIPRSAGTFIRPGTCTTLVPGTPEMYLCSSWVAIQTSAGSLITTLLMIVIGIPAGLLVRPLMARVPTPLRAFLAALTVTAGTTMAWAGMTPNELLSFRGLVSPQQAPAAIGVYTFLLACFTPLFQSLFAPLLRIRDRIPRIVLLGFAIVVPLAINILLLPPNNAFLSETAAMTRQQSVVIISMFTPTAMLFPRGRQAPLFDILALLRRLLSASGAAR